MFEAMERRVAGEAARQAEEYLARAGERFAEVPGVRVSREGDAVRIEGRGLMRRFLSDTRLRFGGWR